MESRFVQLLLLASACSVCLANGVLPFPDFIEVPAYGLAPEGIGWDNTRSRFILGSTRMTKISSFESSDVNLSSGALSEGVVSLRTLVKRSNLLASGGTVGLFVDEPNDRLWACNTQFGATWNSTYMGGISLVKLSTGAVLKNVDLTGLRDPATAGDRSMFVNDVAVASDGNAYATNSFDRQVFQITPEGKYTAFTDNAVLAPATTTAWGLNGIVAKDNYILVGKSQKSPSALDESTLYKISLNDQKSVSEVTISGGVVRGLDGMVWDDTKTYLYIVSGGGFVFTLKSDNEWQTATLLNTTTIPARCVRPTTAAFLSILGNKDVWVNCADNFGAGPYAVQRVRGVPFSSDSSGASTRIRSHLMLISVLPLLLRLVASV